MRPKLPFPMVVSVLATAAAASASPSPVPVVSIHCILSEVDPEQIEHAVTIPLEQVLYKLDGVAQVNSSTSHGTVDIEIQFEGETTEQDLATVISQIEQLDFGDNAQEISCAVELLPPRLSYDEVKEQP